MWETKSETMKDFLNDISIIISQVLKDDKENYEKRKALHVELQKTKKTHSRLDYRIFATQ